MLTLRHLVETSEDGLHRANPKERVLLEYYANSIAHLTPGDARSTGVRQSASS